MAFRPCIDLKDGRVVQIVGGTLTAGGDASVNFISEKSAADYAQLYRRDSLRGGHIIMLGPGNEAEALAALRAFPGGLQVGGGINDQNAQTYLDAEASHVIVTSYLFENGEFSWERLETMAQAVGQDHLVVDLSCRRGQDGEYYVATNRWQTVTRARLDGDFIRLLEPFCDEFLVHAADVEGKQAGIDEDLVTRLGSWVEIPTTYAGGAKNLDDVARVEELSGGKVDLTIGSALDIFGGSRVRYEDAVRAGRHSPE